MSGTAAVWTLASVSTGTGSAGSLVSGTYAITFGNSAVDGGYGANGATPAVQFYQTTSANPMQSWNWNGSTFQNVGYAGHYMADAGNGTISEPPAGDTWSPVLVSGGYTIRNNRTGNYLSNVSGTLSMSKTATVWTITPRSSPIGCLVSGTFTITTGNKAIDGGFGANGATPGVQFYQTTPGNAMQSWTWNGSMFQNLGYEGHYMADGGNGQVSEPNSGDTWTVACTPAS
jgi:hypothetical protein